VSTSDAQDSGLPAANLNPELTQIYPSEMMGKVGAGF
jgi:hypothetical protein